MPLVQQILRSEGLSAGKFVSAAKCQIPKCPICEYTKQHRKLTKGITHIPTPSRDGSLKFDDLRVMDQQYQLVILSQILRGECSSLLGRLHLISTLEVVSL